MERVREVLDWQTRSDETKTLFLLFLVGVISFGSYGLFMFGMGTTTPLVVVTSESMVPTLHPGDLLILQGRPADQIRVGDIIVFQDSQWYTDAPIVHRVVAIEEVSGVLHFTTKGDANPTEDPGTRTPDEIIGVRVATIPYVGYVSMFLKTPAGIALIVILFIIILVGPELVRKDGDGEDEEPDGSTPSDVPEDDNT